jgi:AAA15 family ATPase/GTPase
MSESQTHLADGMLASIHIEGFKGFKNTDIGPLRRVNLILGGQNVGKTSLLEAVYLGGRSRTGATPFRLLEGNDQSRFTATSFHPDFKIIFKNTKSRESLGWDNLLPISIDLPSQTTLADIFEQLVILRRKRELIEMLRQVEPRLEDMHGLFLEGDRRIYVELTGVAQALPLPQMGHGFSRLVYLYCSLLAANAKLALIDELENGIHYSSLPIVFEGLRHLALDRDVQLMMTTHSWEAIRAACEVFADCPDLFQTIRLERTKDDNVRAVCIDGERMLRMVEQDMEVR